MTKNIENLAKGEFFSVKINVLCDVNSLGCDLYTNRKYEDTILIYNDKESYMSGEVYSTNNRVTVTSDLIDGKNYKLTFMIDTTNIENNEIISGELNVITNLGELTIPYKYLIYDDEDTKVLKRLNTINDYYNLVTNDVNIAFNIFNSKKIYKTKMMLDDKVSSYYEMISKGSSKYISFYEFFSVFGYDIKSYLSKYDDNALKQYFEEKTIISVNNDTIVNNNLDIEYKDILEIIDKTIDKDLIDSLAISFVRKGFHDYIAFNVFVKTLSYGSTINNLYKAILESLPNNFNKKLPLYVYRFFYEDKSYTFEQKISLYENIITVFNENDDIYRLFFEEIKQFALQEIYQNKISEPLVKLYKTILKPELVNSENASNILYLVRNYKLTTANPKVKYVIIKYFETNNETRYEINNNICYFPVFFDSYIILFEDISGNILYNIDYDFKVLFEEKNIENLCLSMCQDKNLFYFSKFIDLKEKDFLSNIDVKTYFEINDSLNITDSSKYKINTKVIDYLFNKTLNEDGINTDEIRYLEDISFQELTVSDKKKVLKIMLDNNNYNYVYNKICRFSIDLLSDEDKINFFEKSIETNQHYIDNVFIYLLYDYVNKNNKTIALIQYLNTNFEGSIDNMYKILKLSKDNGINVQELAKKMLIYMLSSYDTKYIDDVFTYYDYKYDKVDELLVPYLTCKSYEYFCYEDEVNDNYVNLLFEFLFNNVDNLSVIPIIYLLSYTKYLSTLSMLNNNDMRRVLLKALDILLTKDFIFAYYKKLNKHVSMSESIMNKEYIEYHTDSDFIPRAKVRINNNQNEVDIELANVFKNIFVRGVSVYKDEIVNYKIYNSNNTEKGILYEGSLSYDGINRNYESNNKNTYEYINDIITYYDENNFNKTKQCLIDLEIKQEVTKDLFNI